MQAAAQGLKASLQVGPSLLLVSAFLALAQEVAKGEQELLGMTALTNRPAKTQENPFISFEGPSLSPLG